MSVEGGRSNSGKGPESKELPWVSQVDLSEEQKRLQFIVSGLKERIESGVIPQVGSTRMDSTKLIQAAEIMTDKGLELKAFANESSLKGVESVVIVVGDLGQDAELRDLIQGSFGNMPLGAVEVIMQDNLHPDQLGKARHLGNTYSTSRVGSYTFTSTYAYSSPIITEALVKRIPRVKPQ